MELEILAKLIDHYSAALVLFARQWCATAEDIVQEAFVKLAAQKTSPANPPAWLFRVVRNGALSAARAEMRRKKHEANAAQRHGSWFCAQEEAAIDSEEATHALRELPLELREVIVAHLWGGLTFEEIGEVAGCSASTAHRRYLAGLSHLRERLGVVCPTMNRAKPNNSKNF